MNATTTDDDRWALVAGGSGGIGSQIALQLAADGWKVAITYRHNALKAKQTVAGIEQAGAQAMALQLDLTDPEATQQAVSRVASAGPLSGLVYASGPTIRLDYLSNLSAAQFGDAIDQDLKAFVNLMIASLPHLRERGGAVVAISTIAVTRSIKRDALSATPKAAVDSLMRAIALEEGRYGVRANTIGSGVLVGDGLWETFNASGDYTEEMLAAALRATPLRRFAAPEDVAAVARFLMSDGARMVSGQTINVDGGFTA